MPPPCPSAGSLKYGVRWKTSPEPTVAVHLLIQCLQVMHLFSFRQLVFYTFGLRGEEKTGSSLDAYRDGRKVLNSARKDKVLH